MIDAFQLLGRISLQGGTAVANELNQIGANARGTGGHFVGMGLALKGAGLAVGAIATGAGALVGTIAKVGISYNAMSEQSQVAWTTLLGSQKEAKTMLEDIANFAKATPFETEQVDTMAKYMHNAGYEGKELFNQLMKVSDVSSAFNIPASEAQELARQMSQVQQAGVAYTEDLNVLGDRGVPIYKALAEVMGTNVAGVKKMASEGKITSDVYNKAFNSIAGSVKGASKAQSETFNGMISSLSDGAKMLAGILTEKLFAKAKDFLAKVTDNVGKMVDVLKGGGSIGDALKVAFPADVVDGIIDAFNRLKTALNWIKDNWTLIVSAIGGIATALIAFNVLMAITTAFRFLNAMMIAYRAGTILATLAQWGFNTALLANPITWIAIAIGVLVGVIIYLWLNWDKVSKWLHASWDKIKKKASDVWNGIKTSITNAINNAKTSITNVWNGIKTWLSNTWENIKNTATSKFNALKTSATNIFNAVKNAMQHPVETAKKAIGTALDWVRNKFNGLHLKFPHINLPHFTFKNFSLNPANWVKAKPSIGVSWYADGGLVNRAQLIGAGEAGNEAILPLQGRHMFPMAKAISEFLGQDRGGVTRIEVPLILNGREIARAIVSNVDAELQRARAYKKRGI